MSNLYNLKQPVQAEQYWGCLGILLDLTRLIERAGEAWSWLPEGDEFMLVNCREECMAGFSFGDWFVYYGPDAGWEILSDEEFKDTFTQETADEK